MAAHRYWKLDNLQTADTGNYVAGAACLLRQTIGGADEIPIASVSSPYYADPPAVLYDGNPLSWWASQAAPRFVAFDYGSPISVAEILWQNRPDYVPQGCLGGDLLYSDTSLSGPWLPAGNFTFSAWTSAGETQTTAVVPIPPGISISEQSGYAALLSNNPGVQVSEQAAYAALRPPSGLFLSEQAAYVVLLAPSGPTGPRRQPLPVGGF